METFSALGGQPAQECMRQAEEADAIICIVAHRYGYVPPVELGGDGESSITWLEVAAAKAKGKPVLAFLVDPNATWTEQKEQDRLVSEPEKATEIIQAVNKLQEFKSYLSKECTLVNFTSADNLAHHVTAAVANLERSPESVHTSMSKVWTPLICHALQPAQHFQGRETNLKELIDWLESPVTPDRVISIVAAGGTGKTALVDQAIHRAQFSGRAGLFVWSFYEEPNTGAFLRSAYTYFTGEKDAPGAGMLERLQLALSGDSPHILILDGLERVQSEGDYRKRGELEDMQLKRFVKAVAGGVGSARLLVTSRFPMVDLEAMTGAGHRAIMLDDLDIDSAVSVLRSWGVNGDKGALTRLLKPLNIRNTYHALAVTVLGSFIGNYLDGDPSRGPEFSLQDAGEDDPKARKLARILDHYAEALTQQERDLLARLAIFPRGVALELLGWIAQAGGAVAGTLIGLSDKKLALHLERLKKLGLVFRYEQDGRIVYTAHPFLREYFRNLLLTSAESVHESVRVRLAPSLDAKPGSNPQDSALLDRYELLIEETALAGNIKDAFDIYWFGLGNLRHLSYTLGENSRTARLLQFVVPGDNFAALECVISLKPRLAFLCDFGLATKFAGELGRARSVLEYGTMLSRENQNAESGSAFAINQSTLEAEVGNFPIALEKAECAIRLAVEAGHTDFECEALGIKSYAHFSLGDVYSWKLVSDRALKVGGSLSAWFLYFGAFWAECMILIGKGAQASELLLSAMEALFNHDDNNSLCRSNSILCQILAPVDANAASKRLQISRQFSDLSGNVELQLRCYRAASVLNLRIRDLVQAIAEAESGVLLADTCGFGKYSIDIRNALAETLIEAGDFRSSLKTAREALDRSEEPQCQYAWGKADGLHFCGVAHLRLGEIKLAQQRLSAALEIRERLGHGRVEETRKALAQCG